MPNLKVRAWQLSEASATRPPYFSTVKIISFRINHNFLLFTDKEIYQDRVAIIALEVRVETRHSTVPTATKFPSVWATIKASTSTQSKATLGLTSITTTRLLVITLEHSLRLTSVLKAPVAPPTALSQRAKLTL